MPNPQGYATGHVRRPDKDHLINLAMARGRVRRATVAMLTPPSSWDSRALGWVPPIKDQSQCGSCWDFSGTGVIEIALIKAGVLSADGSQALSEEYTLDCGRNGGCNGDDNVTVLEWAKATGLPLSSEYGPYRAQPGTCKFKSGMKLYRIDDWGFADGQGNGVSDTTRIKQDIMAYGSAGCAVDAGFDDPGTGVISGRGNNIDHDVILVGWDDTKGRHGAWIMRNSWGTGWGDRGYAWIEYGSFSIGTEAVHAVVTSVKPPDVIDWSNL